MLVFKLPTKDETKTSTKIASPLKPLKQLDTIDEVMPYRPGTPIPDKKKRKRYNST